MDIDRVDHVEMNDQMDIDDQIFYDPFTEPVESIIQNLMEAPIALLDAGKVPIIDKVQCTVCGKWYKPGRGLSIHMATHKS